MSFQICSEKLTPLPDLLSVQHPVLGAEGDAVFLSQFASSLRPGHRDAMAQMLPIGEGFAVGNQHRNLGLTWPLTRV